MVSLISKSFIFSAFFSLNLLVSGLYANRFDVVPARPTVLQFFVGAVVANTVESLVRIASKAPRKQCCPVAGYQNEVVPVASEIQTVSTKQPNGQEYQVDAPPAVQPKINVVTDSARKIGGRVGYFEVNALIPQEGSVWQRIKGTEVGVAGFTASNVVKTVVTSWALRAALEKLAAAQARK